MRHRPTLRLLAAPIVVLSLLLVSSAAGVPGDGYTATTSQNAVEPETSIDSGPSGLVKTDAATFTFSSLVGSTFECSLDGAAFEACASPKHYVALAQGEHTFEVRATDAAGNTDTSPASRSWTVDTIAPDTAIDSGPSGLVKTNEASFAFSSESGATFECSLDGLGFTSCTSPQQYADLAQGLHTFEVRATDAAGNTDASPASRSWTVDTIAPDTSVDSGPSGLVRSAAASFTFSGESGASFECSLDGASFTSCTSPRDYVDLAQGLHTFEVRSVDAAGNTDPSPATRSWTVDTIAPETGIDSGPSGLVNTAAASFVFSSESGATFECSLDGATFAACTSPREYASLGQGAHTFQVRATDPAGNTDASAASRSWTVDTVAPETSIDSGPSGSVNTAAASFGFSSEAGATFECSLDGAAFTACTSPKEYTSLGQGAHTFEVRATDAAGNTEAPAASRSWTVDTLAPDTSIDSGPSGLVKTDAASFAFSSEGGATFECSLDGAAFAACTSPKEYTSLGQGAHTFEVRARDAAGNTDASPSSRSWTVDTIAPETSIESGPSGLVNTDAASFRFSSETGATFKCSLDGAAFAACTSPQDYVDLAEGLHTFEVRATDAAGNTDASPATRNWTVDTIAPDTAIDSGPSGAVSTDSATFTFSSETGAVLECSLDGAAFDVCVSPASYTALADGPHTFEVRSRDAAGNTDTTPASQVWSVDTTAPESSIDSAPLDPTSGSSPSFEFSASEAASFECALDGAAFAGCTSPHSYTNLTEGTHTFAVRAIDAVGNVDPTPAEHTWEIDRTAPNTSISSSPPNPNWITSASFSFDSTESGTFECKLDAGAFTACTSPASYTDLAEGSHTFEARAIDEAGNTDQTPAAYTWAVDTSPPDISVDDVGVTERDAGTVDAVFTVELSEVSSRTTTVDYASANNSAVAGADYAAVGGTLTFAPHETSKTIAVAVSSDLLDENDEAFFVNLTNATNAAIADAQGVGTITDNDPLPQLSVNNVTVTEGAAGTVNANFTVSLDAPSGRNVSVAYSTMDNDATAPADYVAKSGTLNFTAGQTSQQVTAAVNGDSLDEDDETFRLNLSSPVNALIADAEGFATITDDDPLPALTINDVTVTEGNTGTTNANFTVTLGATSGRAVTVDYTTVGGSATAPSDFAVTADTLTFAAGQTTRTISVPVNGDLSDESTETYAVRLSNAWNAVLVDNEGAGTIIDDDGEPTLAINDVTVTEGHSGTLDATFSVSLTPSSGQTVSVGWTTVNGTAVSPADYAGNGGSLVFAPGQTSKTVTVQVNGDLLDEFDESFSVALSNPVNATVGDESGLGTIVDDDSPPRMRIGDATVVEGNLGTVAATFNVTLDSPSGRSVSVNYATENDSASAPADYDSTSGTLTFAPGELTKTVTVTVNADLLDETNETYRVNLSTPTFAGFSDSLGVGTITDDDAFPALSVTDATVVEGDSGQAMASFTVTLSPVSGRDVVVNFATSNGDATAPADYANTFGTLTFLPGETTKIVSVPVAGDLLDEVNETFTLTLSDQQFATLADATAIGTISDDDALPQLAINDVTVTEGHAGTTNATFTVSLNAASGRTVTAQYATANDTATAPADYTSSSGTLTFAPGDTTKTITVPVNGDGLDEIDETFRLNLTTPTNAVIADGQGVGTITDDEGLPELSIGDATVTEGNSGTVNAVFDVTLSAASGRQVSVDYATQTWSSPLPFAAASAPEDYAATSGTLTFAPGQTVRQVSVPVNGDLLDEDEEGFSVFLSNAVDAVVVVQEGFGHIEDDDAPPAVNAGDATAVEGDEGTTTATFTVSLGAPSGRAVSVAYATTNGSATSPADFTAVSGTVNFAAGETAKTVDVTVSGDVLDEADADTFTLLLSSPVNAAVGDGSGLGTITDDDATPSLAIDDVTVVEGDSGTATATFTVTLNPVSGRLVTVNYATSNVTAGSSDYAATSGSLSFAAGETTKSITVLVNGDLLDEINETFAVTLSGALNATIADATGAGTITDDDGTPSLSVSDATVTEGNGSNVNAAFTIALSAPSGQTVDVSYTTADGTATAGVDYTAASGALSFTPGQTTKTVTVVVNGDALDEFDETFTLGIAGATNATITDPAGLGTITDNDPLPSIRVNDVTVVEGDTGTAEALFSVSLDEPSGRIVTVDYASQTDSAISPVDFTAVAGTLSFSPGETTKTVAVSVNGDVLDEINETFYLVLSNAVHGAIVDGTGVGTITDDDAQPALSVNDATVTEGDSGTVNATFTVGMSAVSGRTVTVNYATANGTGATAPADYGTAAGTLSFAPGDTTKTITIAVNGDVLDEGDDTFVVNLSNAVGATVSDAQGLGTITDDDATPSLTINDVTVVEGHTGTVAATFTVVLSAASGRTVTVDFATANGTALSGSDYVARAGSVTFAPGLTTQTVAVTVNGDTLDEASETYSLNLSGASNATIADETGVGTIIDDDGEPLISVTDAIVTEGNSGTANASFTVSLSAASGQTVSVGFATADFSATSPADFAANGGSVVFNPGQTSKTVTVAVKGDTLDEFDELYHLNLSNPVNAQIADNQAVGTITDDDAEPTLSVNNVNLAEGNSGTASAIFTVSLNAPSGRTVSVDYSTADGSALAPDDYTAAAGTLTFAPGETTKNASVQVKGDLLDEADETFSVNLTAPSNASIGDGTGVGTITDDDGEASLSINDVSVLEGNTGTAEATFTVTLSATSGRNVSFNYATANASATAPADFAAASGTAMIAAGETTKTITVAVNGDVVDEADEAFNLNLTAPLGATVADGTGVATITDDDAAPALSINDVTVSEGDAGTVSANFNVTLNAPSGRTVTATWATANGTAVAPGDYVTRSATTLSFAAGQTSQSVSVVVNGDLLDEVNETYFVNLANPSNATLGDDQGVGTILDDDAPPNISIDDVTLTEGNSGTVNATFTVGLSGASGQTVSVGYSTADASAKAGADYAAVGGNVIFDPGQTTRPLTVQVTSDVLDELDETFVVNLAGPVNAAIADGQGVGTVLDDDDAPTVSVADVTVTEGNTGTTNAVFTLTLSRASGLPVTVDFATTDASAASPGDYTSAAGTASFAAGDVSKQVAIAVKGDVLDEENETFLLGLSNATNAAVGDGQAVGTITDDDATPAASVSDVTVTEGTGGTTTATFTVTLNAASGRTVTVNYATADGSATATADYTAGTGTLSYAPAELTKTVTVDIAGDALDELDETFNVILSAPTNATVGDGTGVSTITDDDATPTLAINDISLAEGDGGTTAATFAVSLSAPSGRPVTVNFASADVTANAPSDYTANTGSLAFAPGDTLKAITILVKGDVADEPDETFLVNLAGPTAATLADAQGVGTIVDDDGVPSLLVDDVTVTEGQSGTVNASFTVSLSNASGQTVTVNYATGDGTATAGADYTSAGGTLTFGPGVLTRPVTVQVTGDMLDEVDEVFTVNLSNATNAAIGDGLGLGTITDDDPSPSLTVNDVAVAEGNTGTIAATFAVTLSGTSGRTVTVNYATADGSAAAPADYQAAGGTLSFTPGETTKTVTVSVKGDSLNEVNETYALNLENSTNATIADAIGVGTITDDDPVPTLSIEDVAVAEGDSGSVDATFTVSLSVASGRTVTVNYASANGSATAPADYTATSGALSFAPGDTAKTITVPVAPDLLDEATETFNMNLSGAVGASLVDSSAVGAITDNDPAPALSINDATVTEGNTGTTSATFTVALDAPSGQPVTVQYATANNTAVAPADYSSRSATTLTFAPGQTTQQVTIPVNGDALDEDSETYFVNLSNSMSASIADTQGVGTIVDDDAQPSLTISDATVTEGNSGTANAGFTVTLSAPSGKTVSAHYATADGTATAGSDYTAISGDVVFTPNQTSKTLIVPVTADMTDEQDETFTVTLSEAVNVSLADAQGQGTITDDDGAPTLSVSDVTVDEGNTGVTNATFTVSLARASALPVTVDYATAEGTATAPSDFTTATGTILFAGGEVSKQVVVQVKTDTLNEATETFTLGLENARNATVSDGVGLGTITNDDPLPVLTVTDATVTEGNAGTVNAAFTVTLGPSSGRPVSVDYATTNGTALAPGDFAATSGGLTFAVGETTKTVNVVVNADALDEFDETFTLNLSNAPAATLGDPNGLGTITDDDATPTLVVADATVVEGNAGTVTANFKVDLSAVSGRNVSVAYATANGSAAAPADFAVASGTLTFAPGETTTTIPVTVNADVLDEIDETFAVNLSNEVSATVADGAAVGTITDDDATPSLSINDVTVTEGQSGTSNAGFTVTLSAASGRTVTVDYSTENDTAVAGTDYELATGTVTFAPGQTTRPITVRATGDFLDEIDETYRVVLSGSTNATIADALGVGTITDDDAAPSVSVSDATVAEGDTGAVVATFTATLNGPSGRAASVAYSTGDGTATSPVDYVQTSGTLNFNAGETTKTVAVTVNGDTLDELDETFSLTLSAPVNVTIADGAGLGRINDDDASPELAISNVTVTEVDTGSANANFTVTLSAISGRSITVNYATVNGSATAPGDYAAATGLLTFAPGDTTKTIVVPVNGDELDEENETFTVVLSGATGATLADAQGLGTITDNDPLPSFAINDVTVVEGNSGTTAATFTVSLNAASGRTTSVAWSTENGTATSPGDYASRSATTLTFAPGQTSQQVTVLVNGDTSDEVSETYFVNLTGATNATIADSQGAGTIIDDDGTPSLTISNVTVPEGNSGTVNASFTVTLAPGSGQPVSVGYETADGTATAGADYVTQGGNLVFTPGQTTKTVTVPVTSDHIDEIDETFVVNLEDATNAELSDAQGVGTINDDDAPPSVSVNDVAVAEGDIGSATATFTVKLQRPSGFPIAVDYATADGTAAAPADYTAATGTLAFAAGETEKQVAVEVKADVLSEADESYTLNLSNPTNATIGDGAGLGTINDNDPLPALGIDDVVVTEGDSGTKNAIFTLTLAQGSGRTVTVNYATTNDSATAAVDYEATTGTATFSPGERTRSVTVPVNADLLDEADEVFFVKLSGAVGATIVDNSGTATITDNDDPPTLVVNDVTVNEGDPQTVAATFTVSLSAPSGRVVSVRYETEDNTATAPGDYFALPSNVLRFQPGEQTKTVTATVNGDVIDEVDETFFLDLKPETNGNAGIADARGVGTIVDDDGAPTLSINDVTVTEGQSGTVNANFVVTLSAPSGQTVTADYATADGTATAGADYTAAGGTLTFAPGQTSRNIPVQTTSDTADEVDETYVVLLRNAVNVTVADDQGLGVILDDDVPPPPTPAPPPPPSPAPPAPPAPPDTTPPAEITNLRVRVADQSVTVTWTNPADGDFQRVSVIRTAPGKTAKGLTVYDGGANAFTDRGVRNGLRYKYRLKTYDRAGNASVGVEVAAVPTGALFGPIEGATVTAPPLLRWKAVRKATYYNIQLYVVQRGRQVKVLSAWPTRTSLRLRQTWRFEGKTRRLVPGTYRWYVWPGLGKRSAKKYGGMLGDSSFTVKGKAAKAKRKK